MDIKTYYNVCVCRLVKLTNFNRNPRQRLLYIRHILYTFFTQYHVVMSSENHRSIELRYIVPIPA